MEFGLQIAQIMPILAHFRPYLAYFGAKMAVFGLFWPISPNWLFGQKVEKMNKKAARVKSKSSNRTKPSALLNGIGKKASQAFFLVETIRPKA